MTRRPPAYSRRLYCADPSRTRQIERDLLEEALRANENEEESGPIPQHLRDEAEQLFRSVKSGDGPSA